MSEILTTRGLAYTYPGQSKPVFQKMCLAVHAGSILTILGPNGVGKSTLLRCLAGLAHPGAGTVMFGNRPINTMNDAVRARHLAFMTQSEEHSFNFSVEELVLAGRAAYLGLFGRPQLKDRMMVKAALGRLGISHLATRHLLTLSGGERQLVRLARALVQGSAILLLDEPSAHLDLSNQRRVLTALHGLAAEGLGIALSTHDPNHAFACGGDALLFGRDGWWLTGAVNEIVTATNLEKAYSIPIELLHTRAGIAAAVPYYGL